MDKDVLSSPDIPTEPRMWPGKRLRAARQAQGLTLEEVSRHLHQDIAVVTALEEDNYESLPGQTYVMGYLRSYAKLLKLPEEELVDVIYSVDAEEPALLPQNINYKSESLLQESPSLTVLLVLLFVVAAAGIYWILR